MQFLIPVKDTPEKAEREYRGIFGDEVLIIRYDRLRAEIKRLLSSEIAKVVFTNENFLKFWREIKNFKKREIKDGKITSDTFLLQINPTNGECGYSILLDLTNQRVTA